MFIANNTTLPIASSAFPSIFSATAEQGAEGAFGERTDTMSRSATSEDRVDVKYHFDNDGHIDDLVAFILLQSGLRSRLTSVTLCDGNSLLPEAVETYRRFARLFGTPDLPIGIGNKKVPNPFPEAWKQISVGINRLPTLSGTPLSVTNVDQPAVDVLRKATLQKSVRLVATGPLTNITEWMDKHPELSASVHSMVIMGGAWRVAGNVNMPGISDGSAEWNFFADPVAASAVFRAPFPIIVVPLDATNDFPITDELLKKLKDGKTAQSRCVFEILTFASSRFNYWLWDAVAALVAMDESLAEMEEERVAIKTEGLSQGRLIQSANGKKCRIVRRLDHKRALEMFFELLSGK